MDEVSKHIPIGAARWKAGMDGVAPDGRSVVVASSTGLFVDPSTGLPGAANIRRHQLAAKQAADARCAR